VKIEYRDLGKHKIIAVDGEVDLYNVGELKKSIFDLIDEEDVESLIIDMSDISYMDSSGIGALVAGKKKMKVNDGKFALMNIGEDVLNILKLATLDKFFTIYESEKDIVE
jgi:anti-sigma B factor antagonist